MKPALQIGELTMDAILAGKPNAEVLAIVREKFPGASSASSVAWYRKQMRKKDPSIQTSRAVSAAS